MPDITVGLRAPYDAPGGGALARFAARAEAAGLDRLCVGDHVTFKGGRGFDGLVNATALAMATHRIVVQTAVYLLPLRHPVTVARQVSTLAALAPARLSFGVGVGGEDPAEVRACGVDPATRGRRMDEALTVLRPLLSGAAVSMSGEFFCLESVRVSPPPAYPVPVIVGGRSEAALRRAGRYGDGWLGLWVSPARYADAVGRISKYAASTGRAVERWQHAMHVWCAFGASAAAARARLAPYLEDFYQTPFSKFERYCPCGTPEEIAGALRAYMAAGCRLFNLIPLAGSAEETIAGADAVRTVLREEG
jgi:alkanesulfonate monooxygenase SsuD/methylene tetrahydromethanopterin reductase-like flavin-dependent oxidoreductase (luciferase family)